MSTYLMLLAAALGGPHVESPGKSSGNYLPLEECVVSLIKEASVPAREAGVLTEIPAREGMQVKAGDLLATVDDKLAKQQEMIAEFDWKVAAKQAQNEISVKVAESAAKVAEAEYQEALDANRRIPGTVPPATVRRLYFTAQRAQRQIEQAKFELGVAEMTRDARKAQLDFANFQTNRRKIQCPLPGVVVKVFKQKGEWVNPGDPVLRILWLDKLRVEGFVNVADFPPQKAFGRKVRIRVHSGQGDYTPIESKITFVSPIVEANGDYRVWADIENPKVNGVWTIFPGMTANMELELPAAK